MHRKLLMALVVLSVVPSALALTDEEVFRNFRFNLINPGARSLGLGGAFLSLADDATAAQANPAGLSFLLRPEYFVEFRSVDNAAQSSVVNESLPAGIDTFVATGTDLEDRVGASFVSAVINYGSWTMGISRQELLNIDNSAVSSFAFTFQDSPGAFLAKGTGSIDVEVVNFNLSVGAKITDEISIGGTFTFSQLDFQSEVVNTIVDTQGILATEEDCGGQLCLVETFDLRTTIDDEDDDVIFSLGVIYKPKTEKWSLGAVYRRAPRFRVLQQTRSPDDPGEGLDLFEVRDRVGERFVNRFSLPDAAGIGASWRPNQNLTLALDIERISYSNLLDGYISGVNVLTDFDAEFTIDDATDVRLGAEYILPWRGSPLWAVRGGVFTEDESTIRARSTGTDSFATEEVFQGGGRQEHLALGLGVIFDRYKIDLAADFSETDNEYLVSFIYRGKR